MALHSRNEPRLGVRLAAFPYQEAVAERVRDLEYAAIFHEQGLGKTKMAFDIMMHWLTEGVIDSVVIVTKRGLIENWKDELRQHTFMEPRLLEQDRAANYRAYNTPARLYLTHYEVLVSERPRFELFLRTRKVGVILDEAHRIKNPDTALAQTLHALRLGFVRRLIMTGTPVANRPQDLWSQIFFLDGGATLGTDYKSFAKRADLVNDLVNDPRKRQDFEDALEEIPAKLATFCVRETKSSVNLGLPEKLIVSERVDLEHRQREIYDRYVEDTEHIVMRDGLPQLDDAEEILKRLTRLIQVASNPKLVDGGYGAEPGKMGATRRIVAEVIDRGEKIIVWTNFVANATWLADELSEFGAVVVHGGIGIVERGAALARFKTESDTRVLVATPGAAKEGLTLTVANNALFFDRSLSLEDYLQAQDRIHRISQTRVCTIINLIAVGTVDEWVDALLTSKREAARLAQGDVGIDAFQRDMSYDYGRILEEVLQAAHRRAGAAS